MQAITEQLLNSPDPIVRCKTRLRVLGEDPSSAALRQAMDAVRQSERVAAMLAPRGADGRLPDRAYFKWTGVHWVLASLADIGYPPGDETLRPLLEQEYEWLLSKKHRKVAYLLLDGRMRRCASQEAYAIFSALALGLDDPRVDELAARLMDIQWPDGGWNCDKLPQAAKSSFMETLIPLRALALYARLRNDQRAAAAADRAADIFLRRRMFRRLSDGSVMDEHFTRLHYPAYWHYDILAGLKVMAEAGFIHDPRCAEALDCLESRRLPDGGFPADEVYYHLGRSAVSGLERMSWGGTSRVRMNPYVTVDALYVLAQSGRFTP